MLRDTGERQVAPTLDGIRKDHINRYQWAAGLLKGQKVLDVGCGIGYGARVLADAGCAVAAIDRDHDALAYGEEHYGHELITFMRRDLAAPDGLPTADAAVAFEIIEHLKEPRPLLRALRRQAGLLLASVPNEAIFPYQGQSFHERHYTKKEFQALLEECGWKVTEWHGQLGIESPVAPDRTGRTLIAVCIPAAADCVVPFPTAVTDPRPPTVERLKPKHVAILGLGPSVNQYLDLVKRLGSPYKFCDAVWAINGLGSVLQCDMVWHMDDMRVQEIRAAAKPESNIAAMLEWLKTTTTPVMTSRAYPDYPATREVPLEPMINAVTFDYFNNTAAWALAYAIFIGVEKVTLFGCEYTYPDAHDAEKGHGCLEFWLGYAAAKGIKIGFPQTTTLMDACYPRHLRLYGYDTRRAIFTGETGNLTVTFEDVEPPTAEEIEERYDHSRHPNALVEEAA